jgi:hypothetical protein
MPASAHRGGPVSSVQATEFHSPPGAGLSNGGVKYVGSKLFSSVDGDSGVVMVILS